MIEPETARVWYDECLCAPVDLSAINWIFAANETTGLPAPLISRLAVLHVERPGPDALDGILAGIRADIAADLGLEPSSLPQLLPEVQEYLASRYRSGMSIRRVQEFPSGADLAHIADTNDEIAECSPGARSAA